MTVTTAQVTTLLENVLFESSTVATGQTAQFTAIANFSASTSTVAGLSAYLASQPEAGIAEQVVRYYEGALGRVPSPSEISFYVSYLEKGLTATQLSVGTAAITTAQWAQVASFFTNSPEFQKDFGLTGGLTASNEGLVITGFYSNVLGRAPIASEIQFYENAIATGAATPTTLLEYFTNSPEYQTKVSGSIQTNLAAAGVAAVAAVVAGTNPLASTVAIGPVAVAVPTTVNLTTGVDNVTGGSGATTFNGLIGTANGGATNTLSALDTITGGSGINTLNVTDLAGGSSTSSSITVTGVQTINWTSAGSANEDLTGADGTFTGVTAFNVLKSSAADTIVVGSGTAVAVTDTAGLVTITGGTTQTVTQATGSDTLSGASGAITVTDSSQTGAIGINGGSNVSVAATQAATNTVTIGGATKPTGTVGVTLALSGGAAGVGGNLAGGAVTITGGTAVTVSETASGKLLTAAGANTTLTYGTVGVTGGSATTSVNITEATATQKATVIAVAAADATDSIVFSTLAAGKTVILDGLTFTNSGATTLTAAQVAAAFANLSSGALSGSSTLGTYAGTFNGYTTGAVTGTSTVLFTTTTAGAPGTLVDGGNGAATTITYTAGNAATTGVTGVVGAVGGAENVTDGGKGTITSVTLSGYGAASGITDTGLTSLSLANSAGQTVTVTDVAGATSLGLTVNNLGAASALDLDAATKDVTYTTLNITTAGKDSTLNVTGAGVTALTVAGTNKVDLTGSTFSALKTVTVSGSAGVTLVASGATVTDFNASATSGAVTATIDGTKATYEGGSGVDTLTLSTVAPTKAISLGAGNDTLILASGTTSSTATLDGGTGTNTLQMVAADAVTASGSAAFATKVIDFQVLDLTGGAGAQTVELAVLGNYNQVVTGAEANAGTLTLDGWTSGGTLTLDASAVGTGQYSVTSASFTTTTVASNVFNLVVTGNGAAVTAGTVTVANVATLNIASNDTSTSDAPGTITHTLTLVDTSATSIKITGNANLTLTNTGNTKVTSIDASALDGGLTVTAAGTVAETIKGGILANHLTASTGHVADTLIGGAAADTITANGGLDTLTGNGGNDLFVIGTASVNANSYANITDAHAGNTVEMVGATTFAAAKLSLAGTAVFQDYVNLAITSTNANEASWFQYGSNTYIVENVSHSGTAFQNGTDFIVQLAGVHDLSTASFNTGGFITLHS